MTILRAASFTDIGKVRKENEDRVLFNETASLFGVADGVGGLPGGGEAAQEAINVVTAGVLGTAPQFRRVPITLRMRRRNIFSTSI